MSTERFDPKKATTYRPVTVVAVGSPARHEMQACGCGEHRERYYVHGIERHYVTAEDYDKLLALYEQERADSKEDAKQFQRDLRDAYAEGDYNARNDAGTY